MTFNLAEETVHATAQEEGLRIDLKSPVSGQVVAWMRVAGLDSKRARNARREAFRRVIDGREGLINLTPEEVTEAGTWALAGQVLEWGGFTKDGGEEMPLTVEDAFAVFKQVPWVEETVDLRLGNRANFTKG